MLCGPKNGQWHIGTGSIACIVDKADWALTVNHAFERRKALDPAMKLPWEQPSTQGIFHNSLGLNLPQVHGIAWSGSQLRLKMVSKSWQAEKLKFVQMLLFSVL